MKVKEFNKFYKELETTDIVNDIVLNTNMWIWLSLTEKQLQKVYELMVSKGSKVLRDINNREYVLLKNDTKIYNMRSDK